MFVSIKIRLALYYKFWIKVVKQKVYNAYYPRAVF